jgi:hypothetical protein
VTDVKRPETVEEFAAQQLKRRIVTIAHRLRQLAEVVEREATTVERVGSPGVSAYAYAASHVQHAITNAIPNLNLDALTTDAADADMARTRALVAEEIATDVEVTIGGYPGNDAQRPKVEVGLHANDAQWAAQIARARKEG